MACRPLWGHGHVVYSDREGMSECLLPYANLDFVVVLPLVVYHATTTSIEPEHHEFNGGAKSGVVLRFLTCI